MTTEFIALDVETANADSSSICQVGLAFFDNGAFIKSLETLVNPEDYFDPINISIHGIDEIKVKEAPKIPNILDSLQKNYSGKILVHHSPFDRLALNRASEKFNLPVLDFRWLDTTCVAHRAWEEYRHSGYNLKNLADHFGIVFNHHDAAEDARAAGEVLLKAMVETGLSLDEWLVKASQRLSSSSNSNSKLSFSGNPDGPLYGEAIVFTGALSIPRLKAVEIAADAGCLVLPTVTNKTTILVVGDQDIKRLAGHEKSTKHRKAEELISKGSNIKILMESDFVALVKK